jgi:hypothetical protein
MDGSRRGEADSEAQDDGERQARRALQVQAGQAIADVRQDEGVAQVERV